MNRVRWTKSCWDESSSQNQIHEIEAGGSLVVEEHECDAGGGRKEENLPVFLLLFLASSSRCLGERRSKGYTDSLHWTTHHPSPSSRLFPKTTWISIVYLIYVPKFLTLFDNHELEWKIYIYRKNLICPKIIHLIKVDRVLSIGLLCNISCFMPNDGD